MSSILSTSLRPISDFARDELARWCAEHGESPYRVDQIRRWIFGQRGDSFDGMHDLPARLRTALAGSFRLFASGIVRHQIARDRTEKLLLELADGEQVECVLMREPNAARRSVESDGRPGSRAARRTVCISTQVGCAMGCVFCASGLWGVKRNLSTGEILDQILRVDRLLALDERITNIVVMGIGEPLANLRNLLPALETLSEKGGLGLGARRITISTVGLPDGIRELASTGRPYNLAVSLHAPSDELRNRLVPVNRRIGIQPILEAADDYFARTGRRVTYEYVLLGGLNDSVEHARQLAALLRSRAAHVNLIPMNAVAELPFQAPARGRTREFVSILEHAGVAATVRKRKGADIDAACGQLRLAETAGVEPQPGDPIERPSQNGYSPANSCGS